MTKTRDQIFDEAFGWVARLRDPDADAADWEGFTGWLEADPAHLRAYEEAAELDSGLDGLADQRRARSRPADPPRSRPASRRAVLGWSAAAALAAMIGYSSLGERDLRYAVETAPGERRSIALAEGSTVHLNGSSKIVLDRGDGRFSRLERGEALFSVVHDPSTTFRVEVAGGVIRDVGTVFNVVHDAGLVKIEVAEGEVLYSSSGHDVSLSQGQTLRHEGEKLTTGRRDPAEVAVWRQNYLSYSSATIGEIAADLSRNTGLVVRASPEVAERKFSGVIMLDRDGAVLVRRASALLSVDARRTGEGWLLTREGQ
jgi:transmembrane sensor